MESVYKLLSYLRLGQSETKRKTDGQTDTVLCGVAPIWLKCGGYEAMGSITSAIIGWSFIYATNIGGGLRFDSY